MQHKIVTVTLTVIHDIFRPYTAIIKCPRYAKLFTALLQTHVIVIKPPQAISRIDSIVPARWHHFYSRDNFRTSHTWILVPYVFILTVSAISNNTIKLNSVVLVRKRNIPIERPPLVVEVNVNFCE
jgi:hypothetical protein